MGLSQAAGDEEPAARVFAGEGSLSSILRADFEAHGLEGFDFPAIGKGMAGLAADIVSPFAKAGSSELGREAPSDPRM